MSILSYFSAPSLSSERVVGTLVAYEGKNQVTKVSLSVCSLMQFCCRSHPGLFMLFICVSIGMLFTDVESDTKGICIEFLVKSAGSGKCRIDPSSLPGICYKLAGCGKKDSV